MCERADYISLHAPATAETRGLFNADRLRKCRRGVRIVNTARGELIDEAALADAIAQGHVGGAGLDVFEKEPPIDWRLTQLPQVIATPHIAASTHEAQEQVGIDTATAVRDFLMDGTVRNAVNFPAISTEDMTALRPFCCWLNASARLPLSSPRDAPAPSGSGTMGRSSARTAS